MHYIPYIKVEYPVIGLFNTKVVSHRYLVLLLLLDLLDLFKVVETDVKLITLNHEVFFSVSVEQVYVSLL
jgi:hypothetical protein